VDDGLGGERRPGGASYAANNEFAELKYQQIRLFQPRAKSIANVEFPIALQFTIERQFLVGLLKLCNRRVIELPCEAARFAWSFLKIVGESDLVATPKRTDYGAPYL
jgi:hypothetical protein